MSQTEVPKKPKVVLIVEDEDLVARLYQQTLEGGGIQAVIARDGEEAMRLMNEQVPDLVILDIMMPKINGMQVLADIKQDRRFERLPVVILSNLSGDYDKELGLRRGAVDYWVKKDVPPKEMERRVKKILGLAKSG